jgi:hypothetical protein
MQAKWEEMFGEKEEEVVEEVKVKKPRKKAVGEPKRTVKRAVKSKKPAERKSTSRKSAAKPRGEAKVVKKPIKKKSSGSKVTKN